MAFWNRKKTPEPKPAPAPEEELHFRVLSVRTWLGEFIRQTCPHADVDETSDGWDAEDMLEMAAYVDDKPYDLVVMCAPFEDDHKDFYALLGQIADMRNEHETFSEEYRRMKVILVPNEDEEAPFDRERADLIFDPKKNEPKEPCAAVFYDTPDTPYVMLTPPVTREDLREALRTLGLLG